MQDLTVYSDNELSLRVFNEEYFYIERHDRDYLFALIDEEFIYNQEQLDILQVDLVEDLNEGGFKP